MKGLATVRQFNLTGNEVDLYESISDDTGGSAEGILMTIAIPVVVTLAGSYLITKWAYPRDFTFFKWLGVPLSITILGLVASVATGMIVSRND